jgi:hypothetical protein
LKYIAFFPRKGEGRGTKKTKACSPPDAARRRKDFLFPFHGKKILPFEKRVTTTSKFGFSARRRSRWQEWLLPNDESFLVFLHGRRRAKRSVAPEGFGRGLRERGAQTAADLNFEKNTGKVFYILKS